MASERTTSYPLEKIEAVERDAARYRWLRDRDKHLHPDIDDDTWAETCARNIDAEIAHEEAKRAGRKAN